MSMTHKAYLFDYPSFCRELKPLLEASLADGSTGRLHAFLERNRSALTSPVTGEALREDWTDEVDPDDPASCGAVALTRYYDLTQDVGTGEKWHHLEQALEAVGGDPGVALGRAIGPEEVPFDPGRMGSYFQSADEVQRHLRLLDYWLSDEPNPDESLTLLREMFRRAQEAGKGLYVTF